MRLRSALPAAAVLATSLVAADGTEGSAEAASGVAVYVYSPAASTVRLRVAEGAGNDCDSSLNKTRFDGEIQSGQMLRIPITRPCVCVSSTSTAFPDTDWSQGAVYCGGGQGIPSGMRGRRVQVRLTSFTVRLDGR